jgi:hypothetical protein
MSLVLGMLSYILGGVFRRSWLPLGELSIGMQWLAVFFLMLLPAGIGIVLGVMSMNRKDLKAWWAVGVIVLNIAMLLTGILLLSPD